jgi:hypothetical protein
MKKITNATTFKIIFDTKSNINRFYDLIRMLQNRYKNYFCKFLDKKYIEKKIPINKFIK